ncbi:MAG: hypothetical protein A3F84_16945 [Candidatus Handelsmanbacteria bacterium RIFCSPLOWO2_12_FULL_64_10]|uniref:NurA domain-containing protein n=1 Tax=Handelsmanbacteria sp. (strain RIFCSPLOWO2_12_FULL_64_10) TaxID=1817868 RepID=A0A1F6CDQ9_HANXR|nr:MAG: hypothetical protein A3F84_16945 [Candidatus Handelsmanbacteria bacterium RIFCSPLOWO2_12_FULL_64_10]
MSENSPTLDEWRRLYEVAVRVKELAPWEWMMEDDIFGVQNPENQELGFISVMGAIGEHFAVAVYLGPQGLYGFLDLEDEGLDASPYRLFEVPQLQASFEDRNILQKEDRDILKSLGLKFRGQNAWPMFRSIRPGFHPWFLEGWEARLLTCALEQALDVTPRFEADPSLLGVPEGAFFVRAPLKAEVGIGWEDRVVRVPPPASAPVTVDDLTRRRLEGLSRGEQKLEVDVFMLPDACREGKGRPFFPYCLMMVEARSGLVLFHDLLQPQPSLEEMWRSVPLKMVDQFAKAQMIPTEVRVCSEQLFDLLKPLAGASRFKLKRVSALRTLEPAREMLMGFLMGGDAL